MQTFFPHWSYQDWCNRFSGILLEHLFHCEPSWSYQMTKYFSDVLLEHLVDYQPQTYARPIMKLPKRIVPCFSGILQEHLVTFLRHKPRHIEATKLPKLLSIASPVFFQNTLRIPWLLFFLGCAPKPPNENVFVCFSGVLLEHLAGIFPQTSTKQNRIFATRGFQSAHFTEF